MNQIIDEDGAVGKTFSKLVISTKRYGCKDFACIQFTDDTYLLLEAEPGCEGEGSDIWIHEDAITEPSDYESFQLTHLPEYIELKEKTQAEAKRQEENRRKIQQREKEKLYQKLKVEFEGNRNKNVSITSQGIGTVDRWIREEVKKLIDEDPDLDFDDIIKDIFINK